MYVRQTCFAILWLPSKVKVSPSQLLTHWMQLLALPWGLILPSSARVFRLTHQTVIGVRYPELVKSTPDGWRYGRYVSTEATLQGDFLPVFWDVPKSDMHAVTLALWLSGCKNTSPLVMTQRITLQCFIIRTIWCESLA